MAQRKTIKKQKDAARYAGVTTRTIRRWKDKGGMRTTPKGDYITAELDKFKKQDMKKQRRIIDTEKLNAIINETEAGIAALTKVRTQLRKIVGEKV